MSVHLCFIVLLANLPVYIHFLKMVDLQYFISKERTYNRFTKSKQRKIACFKGLHHEINVCSSIVVSRLRLKWSRCPIHSLGVLC